MRKLKNRFIALLMIFTSIISLLPAGFGGQTAMAADSTSEATVVRVNIDGKLTPLKTRTDSEIDEEIYTTESVEDAFDITVKDVRTDEASLIDDALEQNKSLTGIVGQEIVLLSINETKLVNSDGSKNAEGYDIIEGMGITIDNNPTPVEGDSRRIGVRILNLPAGVNKIKYAVKLTTLAVKYKEIINSDGSKEESAVADASPKTETKYVKDIILEHATNYVISKISNMLFKAYVGDADSFSDEDAVTDDNLRENNKVPFLYLTKATPDSSMPLRYNFDVPDSLTALKYNMMFGDMLNLNGAILYKNGTKAEEGKDYSIDGQELTGDLSNPNKSDLIVVKINSVSDSSTSTTKIAKAYAIEIRYNKPPSSEDFSLQNAEITKLDFNDDSSVKAYIGKKFAVNKNDAGFPEYSGDIYVDSKAGMISIDPTLIRSKSTVAYVVTNRYVDSSRTTKILNSVLKKDGKQYIDFKKSTISNELQIDIYEGKDGSKTTSSKLLARYLLKVNLLKTDDFSLDLAFDHNSDSDSTYLTQPGVKENAIEFNTSRRTYDLYSSDSVNVGLALKSENDKYKGIRSGKNEYLRIWLADEINSNNLKEAQASIDNVPVDKIRETSINVSVGTAKKMVVQAFYDEFETKTVDGVEQTTLKASYAVGDKYVFYLPNNFDNSNNPDPGETSDNASLTSVKIKGYTLKDSDGNENFSSDVFDYSTTVAKEDTSAKITVTAEDDNVKSIVATIDNAKESYDLVSGQISELPLNSNGTTNIKIVVTAQDGTTTKTYTIVVKNNKKGSNVNLKNVILNVGDYTFDSKEDTTKVRVDQNVTSIKVTPLPEDPKAKVTVEGEEFLESPITVSIKGAQKTEISIEVKSEDGTESKTYTLEVYRVDTADWEDDSDDGDDANEDDQFYDEYNECWVDLTKYEEWGTVNGKPAYFDKKSRQVKDAWISTGGKYYYLNNLGYRATGWKVDSVDGKTYYLDPTTGEMRKGWMNLNNSWYYLGLNGVMHKGWLCLNGKWYYFTPNGQMVVNQSMYVEGKVYKFGQDGAIY